MKKAAFLLVASRRVGLLDINGNLTDKCDDVLRKCYVSESAFEVLSAISVAFALIYNPPRTISFKIKSNEDEEEAMAICMEAVVSTTIRKLIIQYDVVLKANT